MRRAKSLPVLLAGCAIIISFFTVFVPVNAHAAEALHVRNDLLDVTYDSGSAAFLLARPGGDAWGRVRFESTPQDVQVVLWEDTRLGNGQALLARLADGNTGWVAVLPGLPFALLQTTFLNHGTADTLIRNARPFSLELTLPQAPGELRALGTAGLTTVDGHKGSYDFLAIAAPHTRSGVVSAWLSHERGSGVLFSRSTDRTVAVQPQIDYGNLRVRPGARKDSEILAVGRFADARLGLEAYADATARLYDISLPPIPAGYCTWYSKKYGGACDEEHLQEISKVSADELGPYGFDFIQIDDKWQEGERRNGPAKNFFAHAPRGPYPSGMKAAADNIKSLGLTPGIWFMPFAGDRRDPFYLEHLDWFVKRPDGTPFYANWGGTSLDMTNPDARAYTRSVVERIAHEWGYEYFKMDGLWTGTATKILYVNNEYKPDDMGDAVFHNPDKTNIEAYRDGLKLVRDAAGPDVFFLGCNVSQNMRTLGGSYGLLDAMRVGPDNAAARNWKALVKGPWHGTNRYFLHGRVWYNDPDPTGIHPDISLEQVQLICSWIGLTGQLNVYSEWLPDIPEERIDIFRRSIPNHNCLPRPADLFENDLASVWLLSGGNGPSRRNVVGLFNWDDKSPEEVDRPLDWIGLPPAEAYAGYDFWRDEFIAPFSGRLRHTVAPGACSILALRPVRDYPQVISTSRHVSQGIVDLSGEHWSAEARTLEGVSEVVAGDPYELRIAVPRGREIHAIDGATLAGADASTKISYTQEAFNIRVRIESGKTGPHRWRLHFRGGN